LGPLCFLGENLDMKICTPTNILSLVLTLGLITLLPAQINPALAQNKDDFTVPMAEGLSSTKADALTQAKRDAVEKGIGMILQSETEVKNFMVEKDVVLTKTMGAVKSYQVLSETQESDGNWKIKISAVVSKADISKELAALRILLESMDKPRMMVLIRESHGGQFSPDYKAAETAVLDFLTSKEFNMVDPGQVAALLGSDDESIRKATEGDAVAAAKLGRDNGAENIIVGNAVASVGAPNAMLAGMSSGQADLTIKVINCATGKIIVAKQEHAAKPHISPETAMTQAVAAVANKVMDQKVFAKIVETWQDVVNNGTELAVTVSNVKAFKDASAVKATLTGLGGSVVKITQRGWDKNAGILTLTVLFKGNAEAFCNLADNKNLGGSAKINVGDYKANAVKLEIGQ
jgi:hypothetical protein